jgi:thiol-disulfide isomerase/thioredoxin
MLLLAGGGVGCTSTSGDAVPPLRCWDRNANGVCDLATEDIAGADGMGPDQQCDTIDCSANGCLGDYPAEATGSAVGQVIADYAFTGYARPQENRVALQICLDEFYNPMGNEVYEDDSPFAGEPKPTLLLFNVSALWCGPCKDEAHEELPSLYAAHHANGLEILTVLTDSGVQGDPATIADVGSWVDTFPNAYPVVNDPDYQTNELADSTAYPANFVIETSDMRIVRTITGPPDDGFEAQIAALLAGR